MSEDKGTNDVIERLRHYRDTNAIGVFPHEARIILELIDAKDAELARVREELEAGKAYTRNLADKGIVLEAECARLREVVEKFRLVKKRIGSKSWDGIDENDRLLMEEADSLAETATHPQEPKEKL